MILQYILLKRKADISTILSMIVLTLLTTAFPLLGPEGVDGAMTSSFAIGMILLLFHIVFVSIEQATFETTVTSDRDVREAIFALEAASFPVYLTGFLCLTSSRGFSFDMHLMDSIYPLLIVVGCVSSRCVQIACLHVAVKDVMLYTTTKALRIVLGSVAQVVFFTEDLSTAQWVLAFVIPIAVVEFTFVKSSAQVNRASDGSNDKSDAGLLCGNLRVRPFTEDTGGG